MLSWTSLWRYIYVPNVMCGHTIFMTWRYPLTATSYDKWNYLVRIMTKMSFSVVVFFSSILVFFYGSLIIKVIVWKSRARPHCFSSGHLLWDFLQKKRANLSKLHPKISNSWGVHVPSFFWNKLLCSKVPQIKILFLIDPVPKNCPCSPKFRCLLPCSQPPWEGLSIMVWIILKCFKRTEFLIDPVPKNCPCSPKFRCLLPCFTPPMRGPLYYGMNHSEVNRI